MKRLALLLVPLLLAGCTSNGQSTTDRSATEELLISTAADRAAEQLKLHLPTGTRAFVDTADFDATDGKYAIGAIEDSLLRQGIDLVDTRDHADTVIEIRSGALAITEYKMLVGVPAMTVPFPNTTTMSTPEIALYKEWMQQGLAKFAATAYNAKTGALEASTGPKYGYSHNEQTVLLLYFSWDHDDLLTYSERDHYHQDALPGFN